MFKNAEQTSHLTLKHPVEPRTLQIDLYPLEQKHKIPSLAVAKLKPKPHRYLELEIFKQQLHGDGEMVLYHTFEASSRKVRSYRLAFFGLGLFFSVLAAFVFQHNLIFFTVLFGNLSMFVKAFLMATSFMLAFAACWIGCSLCVATEASGCLAAKAKHKLLQLYSCKRIENGLQGIFILPRDRGKYFWLKQQYRHALHKIEDQKEQTLHLLQKIQNYSTVEAGYRELLFNQALAEFNDKLQILLYSFKEEV